MKRAERENDDVVHRRPMPANLILKADSTYVSCVSQNITQRRMTSGEYLWDEPDSASVLTGAYDVFWCRRTWHLFDEFCVSLISFVGVRGTSARFTVGICVYTKTLICEGVRASKDKRKCGKRKVCSSFLVVLLLWNFDPLIEQKLYKSLQTDKYLTGIFEVKRFTGWYNLLSQ